MISVDWTCRIDNSLLRVIPIQDMIALRSHIAPVALVAEQVLSRAGETITEVLFIEDGLISLQAPVADRFGHLEVGLVGHEGVVGLPALLLNQAVSLHHGVVHVSGTALRVPIAQLNAALDRSPEFREACHRYVVAMLARLTQSVVCGSRHSTIQRCARWLLLYDDRMPGEPLPLRQTLLAQILAVHRPGVSAALRLLQDRGCVRQHRGRIEILDRRELERTTCECYARERALVEAVTAPDRAPVH
jgi:CRP-like cAMP-binding protein